MSTQRSLFQLATVAGYNDLPDSLLAAGKIANQLALSAIQSNADFACVGFEIFYFEVADGQEVPLDKCVSAVDGYSYRRSELLYLPEIRTTVDPVSGLPAGPGGFVLGSYRLNQKTGKASIMEAYYVPGETWTNTNQGTLGVWVVGQRGRGRLGIAGSPSFAAIADSEFNTDNALTQTRIRKLNDNARASVPKVEAFILNGSGAAFWQPSHAYSSGDIRQPNYGHEDGCWYHVLIAGTSGALEPEWPGEKGGLVLDGGVLWIAVGFGAQHGQTMAYPVSPVDGYAYSASDACYYLPWWYYTGAVEAGTQLPLGPSVTSPRMYRLRKSVTNRVVNCQVDYHQNTTPINTNDGVLGIMAICVRAGPGAISPPASNYVETDGSQFVPGQPPTDVNLKTLNQNINFARLRPEAFLSSGKVNGNAVPLPTSPADGYAYNRAELFYLTIINDTGIPTGLSANYALRCIVFYTDAQLGIVTSRIDYFSHGNPATTTNGIFSVLTLAFRKAETLLSGVSIIPIVGQATPAPPSDVNLIPNGAMEVWSHLQQAGVQMVGLPDLWSYYQNTQDGYPTQQPGLEGAHALGLNIGDAHGAPSTQYMTCLSYPVAIFPGGTYYFSILARANPAISAGFRVRLHFRDANLDNDVYVTLINRIGLTTTKQKFESRLVMPLQGDLMMQTGKWGSLTIVGGPLGYDPAYVFLELANYQPNISSTVIADSATLKNVGETSNQPGAVAYRPTSNMLTATDAGTSATVNVAAFTLRVAGQADVSYSLGSISSLAFETLYFIYCDDPTLRGGAQTYQATVTKEEALNGVGRIFLGSIWTPADGAADTIGNNDGGAGNQIGGDAPAPGNAPSSPSWVEFSGQDGIFHFEIAPGSGALTTLEHEIQLASDSGFSTSLRRLRLGSALVKDLLFPGVTRYARARSRYASSPFSAYVAYGAPTAVSSGHPVDDLGPPGGFDPSDRRLHPAVRQNDDGGTPRHLFRYDDPTHTVDIINDGATYGRPLATALTAGAVDLAKSGVVGKAVELVRNPNFESGDRDWSKGTGFSIVNDPMNAYQGDWVARFIGTTAAGLRNTVNIACQPGDVLVATCMIKRTAGDGAGYVRLIWCDASGAEIGATNGNSVTSSSYAASRVVGTAPASAHHARVATAASGTANTTIYFDQFNASLFPKSIDEISDGTSYARTTPNQRDGGARAYTYIESTGHYVADKYHLSAWRKKITNTYGGAQTSETAWITKGSFVITKPSGETQFKGYLKLQKTGSPTDWNFDARLKIGGLYSSPILHLVYPNSTIEQEVTVSGIDSAEADVTVEVQIQVNVLTGTGAGNVYLTQYDYTDQDGSHA